MTTYHCFLSERSFEQFIIATKGSLITEL